MRPPAKVRERIVSVCARLQRFTLYEITRNLTKTRPVVRQQPVWLSKAVANPRLRGQHICSQARRSSPSRRDFRTKPTHNQAYAPGRAPILYLVFESTSVKAFEVCRRWIRVASLWRLQNRDAIKMNPCQSVIGAELPVLPYCPAGLLWPQLSLARDRPRGPRLALGGDKDIRQPA